MTKRHWREVVAEAHQKLEDPEVSDDIKQQIREKLNRLEAIRIATIADLDQVTAHWNEFCRQYDL